MVIYDFQNPRYFLENWGQKKFFFGKKLGYLVYFK